MCSLEKKNENGTQDMPGSQDMPQTRTENNCKAIDTVCMCLLVIFIAKSPQ